MVIWLVDEVDFIYFTQYLHFRYLRPNSVLDETESNLDSYEFKCFFLTADTVKSQPMMSLGSKLSRNIRNHPLPPMC